MSDLTQLDGTEHPTATADDAAAALRFIADQPDRHLLAEALGLRPYMCHDRASRGSYRTRPAMRIPTHERKN